MSPSRASLPAFSGRLRLRLLGLAAFCATAARAQAEIYNVTVTAPDPSLNYTGKWTDVDNGGHRFSAEAGCSVSLLFQGALRRAPSAMSHLSARFFHQAQRYTGTAISIRAGGSGR